MEIQPAVGTECRAKIPQFSRVRLYKLCLLSPSNLVYETTEPINHVLALYMTEVVSEPQKPTNYFCLCTKL